MERLWRLVLMVLAGLVFSLLASCNSDNGSLVTVASGTPAAPGVARTGSGLEVTIQGWAGGIVTISDILEDDAAGIPPAGSRVVAGQGFIWVPGGTTTTETVFKFPVTGYADGTMLDLFWFDVGNQNWIPFAGVQAAVTGGFAVVTFPDGASALGGNFYVLE